MRRTIVILIVGAVLLLTACQKTPETVRDGNVLRAKSSNDLLIESLVNVPDDSGSHGEAVPKLAQTEHLKRDISFDGKTVHIDADIIVPNITGDIRIYSAQYRFFDRFELEDLFFTGADPLYNPGSEKNDEDNPQVGLNAGGFYFGISEVLSPSNHPTASNPGWAKGCKLSPQEARRIADKLLGYLAMPDLELVSSQVAEPLAYSGNCAKFGRYVYEYVQVADGIPLSSGEPDSTELIIEIDDRGVVSVNLRRLELGESETVNGRVMTLDGALTVLQKKLATVGLAKGMVVNKITFEYMSVEDPETYDSTVCPCWRFGVDLKASMAQYNEYSNDIIMNAVTGEIKFATPRETR